MRLFGPLLAVTLLILPISVYSASIGLLEKLSFTIPKLQGEILAIDFNDIDGDNIPEVLACDTSIWVLYSITGDSIVAWDSLPNLYSNPTAKEGYVKLLLGDVDNDSNADVVVARMFGRGALGFDSAIVITKYDGQAGFQTSVSQYLNGGICVTNCPQIGLGMLEFDDINSDGSKELIFSFPFSGYSLYLQSTVGRTYVFSSFPDTQYTNYYLALSHHEIENQDSSLAFITESYSYRFSELGFDNYTTNQKLAYVDSSGKIHGWNIDFPELPCDIFFDYIQTRKIVSIGCLGELISTNLNLEIVIQKYTSLKCWDNVNGQDSSVTEMAMMKIVSADSLEEVWSKSINEKYDNFVYLPQFPGYFFAFVDDIFTQFDGSDGSVFQATAVVPTGKREWDYPFDDSIPRLIVRNGTSISFYLTDISTPVYEDNPPALPADFRLSQPYPNPFNPQVNLSLFIPKRSEVVVKVFNIVGQQIDVLYNNVASAGELKLQWNAKDNPSGIYLIKATSGKQTSTVKAVLLK